MFGRSGETGSHENSRLEDRTKETGKRWLWAGENWRLVLLHKTSLGHPTRAF